VPGTCATHLAVHKNARFCEWHQRGCSINPADVTHSLHLNAISCTLCQGASSCTVWQRTISCHSMEAHALVLQVLHRKRKLSALSCAHNFFLLFYKEICSAEMACAPACALPLTPILHRFHVCVCIAPAPHTTCSLPHSGAPTACALCHMRTNTLVSNGVFILCLLCLVWLLFILMPPCIIRYLGIPMHVPMPHAAHESCCMCPPGPASRTASASQHPCLTLHFPHATSHYLCLSISKSRATVAARVCGGLRRGVGRVLPQLPSPTAVLQRWAPFGGSAQGPAAASQARGGAEAPPSSTGLSIADTSGEAGVPAVEAAAAAAGKSESAAGRSARPPGPCPVCGTQEMLLPVVALPCRWVYCAWAECAPAAHVHLRGV